MKNSRASADALLRLVRQALDDGARVDIDGLGSFIPDSQGKVAFVGNLLPKVFITYAHEDAEAAHHLFRDLALSGFDPWLDRRKLMPGQNWPRAIENAMCVSDFVIACFSCNSVTKKGEFQAEVRYALDCAQRMPLDHVFLIPIRLDECQIPARITREVHYVDMFPEWDIGIERILLILRSQATRNSN